MKYFLYMLECQNGSFYTGYTPDMERRYAEHISGSPKCKYTRSFPPKRIAAFWEFDCGLSDILKWERQVKSLSRKQKLDLISSPQLLHTFF